MDNKEVDLLPNCNDSMEDLIHELMSETGCCTHVHTCNPPGPDNSHTHTCFHVHTKLITPNDTNDDDSTESTETKSQKRPMKMKKGNREAVRKYREKKKARAASLEGEIYRLKAVNQHLLQKVRAQTALEAEVSRLKCLLVDLRARIHGEISSFFPYQTTACLDVMSPCDAVHIYNNGVDPEKQ